MRCGARWEILPKSSIILSSLVFPLRPVFPFVVYQMRHSTPRPSEGEKRSRLLFSFACTRLGECFSILVQTKTGGKSEGLSYAARKIVWNKRALLKSRSVVIVSVHAFRIAFVTMEKSCTTFLYFEAIV